MKRQREQNRGKTVGQDNGKIAGEVADESMLQGNKTVRGHKMHEKAGCECCSTSSRTYHECMHKQVYLIDDLEIAGVGASA